MPVKRHPVRIAQKSNRESIYITLPVEETGWHDGDVIKFEKQDEDTIILKRMH